MKATIKRQSTVTYQKTKQNYKHISICKFQRSLYLLKQYLSVSHDTSVNYLTLFCKNKRIK